MTQTSQHSEPDLQTASLPFRGDTVLGVCEAIGQDFGFNPNWLRVAFATVFLASPIIVVGTYLALGVVVAISRYVAPNKAVAVPHAPAAPRLAAERPIEQEERELIAA